MAKVSVTLNRSGVRELLKSDEMKAICEEHANKALGKLGAGYGSSTNTAETRVYATVYAESVKAKRENMNSNTILKALRG